MRYLLVVELACVLVDGSVDGWDWFGGFGYPGLV